MRAIASRSADIRGPVGAKALRSACLSLSVRSVPREVVDALVEFGATTTAVDALQYAIESNHAAAVAAMIAGGADPNAPYHTANKPSLPLQVTFFVKEPDPGVVEALLAGGASVDALDNRGLPALNYAAANCRDVALIARLLDAGASPGPLGKAWGALHQAAFRGRVEVCALLLDRGAAIDAVTADGRAAIAMAAEKGQLEALQALLDRGADVEAGTWTALMAAAINGQVAAVDALLDAGADPTRKAANPWKKDDPAPRTAQEHAELAGAAASAARLAERAGGGFATLHAAVDADDVEAVRALLDGGADPGEVRGPARVPALHRARSLAVLDLLLERGADPRALDADGRTALFACAAARDAGAVERMERLLERGADPKAQTASGTSALHSAASLGNAAAARRLVAAGCPVENRRKKIDQPLHLAAGRDDVPLATLLLDAGARLEPVAYTIHGGEATPLHVAAEADAVGVAELLLARGADPGAGAAELGAAEVDEHDDAAWAEGGYTPIHRAAEAGHFAVLATLLRYDRRCARDLPILRGPHADELAEDHPRCQALLRALSGGVTVDEALAQLAAAEGAVTQAEAEGHPWVERVTEIVYDGTGRAPAAVLAALGKPDWVRTAPGASHSLVLRFVRGQYEVAVGDAEGVHALPLPIRAQRVPYAIDPDGARFLVSDGRAVYAVDGPQRTAWEVVPAEALGGEVTEVGWLADGACYVVAGGQIAAFPRRLPGEAVPTPWWSLPAAGLQATHGTGTALVGLVLAGQRLRVVWARFDPDGVRPYAWLDDAVALLTPRREGDRVGAVAYSGWTDPRIYALHQLDGAPAEGPARRALPDATVFGEVPRLAVHLP
ncbi:MAG: ankyrin repeat domain-containing protein [Myxococcota bacterium]